MKSNKNFQKRLKRSKNQFMKNSKNDENEPKLPKSEYFGLSIVNLYMEAVSQYPPLFPQTKQK